MNGMFKCLLSYRTGNDNTILQTNNLVKNKCIVLKYSKNY